MKPPHQTSHDAAVPVLAGQGAREFRAGLVFGFDLGTGSMAHAVRCGAEFRDVGVLLCESEGSDLSQRRTLRRQRRTLRSKRQRRRWFARELAKLGLEPPTVMPENPVDLRCRALAGEPLSAGEMHGALAHLFHRRGFAEVPWANRGAEPAAEKEEGVIKERVRELREEMAGKLPCEWLRERQVEAGRSPQAKWGRGIYWPREELEREFRAIVAAQAAHFPRLAEATEWLLYGDSNVKHRHGRDYHVYFKRSQGWNPGVLGLRWPRFDNRGPALDAWQPVDEAGRPRHVVRRDKAAFLYAQWELAVMNFRVLDAATRQRVDPRVQFPEFVEALHREWGKKGKVTEAQLKKMAAPWEEKFLLIEDQGALSPESTAGRARYASPTLAHIREAIQAGERIDPPQPVLRRRGETNAAAADRFLAEIKHPLVRHRLALFRETLRRLVAEHGVPDVIVVEAVRSLALGRKAKMELARRNEGHRRDRALARGELRDAGKSTSRKAITRYRLWREAQSTCPFCGEKISQEQLLNGQADIEHLVPRAVVDCDELYNLTIGHLRCNREIKGDRTPYTAFSGDVATWEHLQANAKKCFRGRKLEIFLSPEAETLIERKADLQHTAYIARMVRHLTLLELGWVGDDGRDPTIEKGNTPSSAFQVTNGQITSRLRGSWGLNRLLHPLPPGVRWDDLGEEERARYAEKNRGDLRHHALDAMVIACTLPWLAHRTVAAHDEQTGEPGWCALDERTRRSRAINPVFPHPDEMHRVCAAQLDAVEPRQHVSRSRHQRAYDTTIYGQARKTVWKEGRRVREAIPDCYVSREPITALNPKDLKSGRGKSKIFPPLLGDYLAAAWEAYCEEVPEWAEQLKVGKGRLPEAFQRRLCFAAFQRWRVAGAPDFAWPATVKVPIRRVGYVGVENDWAVFPASAGTHGFVARGGYREVRLHPAEDGQGLVPVFVPNWKKDPPSPLAPILPGSRPVATLRRGQIVEIVHASEENPAGRYRIVSTMRGNIKLLPVHLANRKESLVASGFSENGVNIRWNTFIKAAGYELPHPPSA